MTRLPGVSGSLFPGSFLAEGLVHVDRPPACATTFEDETRRRLLGWWRQAEARCGPATGLRALFDLVAMPLAALLGFRAHEAVFDRARVAIRLRTRRDTPVGCFLLPWAERPSRLWRDLAVEAQVAGADWCLLVAPPFVSIVDARGHAVRRSLEFRLPDALDHRSFGVFWGLCQAGAFDPGTYDGRMGVTPIDALGSRASTFQEAVRRDLQAGVVRAIAAIGPVLPGAQGVESRFAEALTLVYRVLFLLFAESRELVPRHHPAYRHAYALAEFCREAARDANGPTGLWDGLAAVTRLSRSGCETADLVVRPFNGRLFDRAAAPSLESRGPTRMQTRASRRRDRAIGKALVALGTRPGRTGREEISYADLGVEQLGAVYERVLDLDPGSIIGFDNAESGSISTGSSGRRHSSRRKETGTFYTPQPLADFVVRRTLAPLVRGASTDDILALRVVDPAMGSGAFLVAACRYLGHAYERALVHEGRCAETDLDANERANIRRLIALRCLAGVDANPVAVQLARLSLWLTTLARGKPLSFLDDRLRVGDSLVGASPDDLWRVRRRPGPRTPSPPALFDAAGLESTLREIARPLKQLREGDDRTVADVRARERLWADLSSDRSPLEPWRLACHLWCARWFWPESDKERSGVPAPAELAAALDAVLRGDRTLGVDRIRHRVDIARLVARDRQFFHWPLEFADVFYGDTGEPREPAGFDAVIGNPPWEMLRRDAAADRPSSQPERTSDDTLAFLRQSGLYPACDRGHINVYQPFLERSLGIARAGGRVGLVLPWGLASDEGAASLRARLLDRGAIDSIVGFDNREGIFPIHRGLRFLVVVASPGSPPREIRARFGVRSSAEIDELPAEDEPGDRSAFPVRLSPDVIRRVGGASRRIPDVRKPKDIEWLRHIATALPPLGDPAGWGARFSRELNATEDRASFGTDGLAVIDGKHIAPFVVDATASTRRITATEARRILPDAAFTRPRLGYRDVSGAANKFTLIAALIPANIVTTHTLFCLRTPCTLEQQHFLCGLFNSSTLNAIVRMLMGGHVTTGLVENLPVPLWQGTPDQLKVAELAKHLARHSDDDAAMTALNQLVVEMYSART